ncbi:MAG: GspH/FimT family protein [bacterium]|nr:GspH/FimT family protein [bacterium]
MTRISPKLTSQSGVSLVELLVVCVVIAIVASLALFRGESANGQFQRQNASRELKTLFERARFDSVKRRADLAGSPAVPPAYVTVELVSGTTQATLFTDNNQDGDLADTVDAVTTFFPAAISVTPRSGLSVPLTISFNRRGEPSVADATMLVCNGTCDFNNDTPAIADIVSVSPTGTVEILPGGSTIVPFPTPPVTSIGTGTAIRSEVYVP